jgi:sphingomyelin phosphodiesterase
LTDIIKEHLGGIPFYPIFGNHECFPADQFDIFQNETQWLKNQTGNIWRDFLDDQAFTSLRLNGYYSMYNEKYNLRVIVLNTQTCDSVNFFLLRNPTDPNHILQWMRSELYIAENNNQTVYIIGHIPPGNQFCFSQWAERYTALVDRFSHVIRGQFFGHTHQDHFESMHSYVDNSLIGTVFIAPSMTTYTQQNPSFRIFEVDEETKFPLNYYQYRLNLSVVNSNKTNETLIWDIAYDILTEYNLPDLSWGSMDKLSQMLLVDKETRKKFIYHFYAGGPIGQLSDDDLDKTYTLRSYHCKTQNPVFNNFVDCLGWTYIEDPLDWVFLALQSLDGNYHTFNQTLSLPNEKSVIAE